MKRFVHIAILSTIFILMASGILYLAESEISWFGSGLKELFFTFGEGNYIWPIIGILLITSLFTFITWIYEKLFDA